MAAYYNENDPKAAAWLRELIARNLIAPGEVDERSIADVQPCDLLGFAQCHFFAGIGGWSYALRLAGWPDDQAAWTGSCPCQPFSDAGARKGVLDSRHLWPWLRHLIFRCRPAITFGEQVASAAGRLWLAGIRGNLEALGLNFAAADLCAAGVAAPNVRQRLFWMAYTSSGLSGYRQIQRSRQHGQRPQDTGVAIGLGISGGARGRRDRGAVLRTQTEGVGARSEARCLPDKSFAAGAWSHYDVVTCNDGKRRRFEPGSFPVAARIPGRMALLRGYGNAINPVLASEFIQACEEALA